MEERGVWPAAEPPLSEELLETAQFGGEGGAQSFAGWRHGARGMEHGAPMGAKGLKNRRRGEVDAWSIEADGLEQCWTSIPRRPFETGASPGLKRVVCHSAVQSLLFRVEKRLPWCLGAGANSCT